ncbi:MAG: FIST N-terminal domain-containing protein [Clostridiaceae bacterium]
MKQYGYLYSNFDEMRLFINNMSISETDTIFIQIMTGIIEVDFIKNLIVDIKKLLTNAEIIGTTTAGEIYEGNICSNSTVLSFTIFEKSRVKTTLINDVSNEYELGLFIGKEFVEEDTKVMIMFSDGLVTCGDDILKGIKSINKKVIIAGGKAGDNDNFKETFVFTKEGILNRGLAIAFISGKHLNITTESKFCWSPIGKEMTITKALNNKVFTIDNIRAVDILKKYLGSEVVNNVLMYSAAIPLIVNKDKVNVARVALECNEDGSVYFAGKVEEGEKVQFGYCNVTDLTERASEIFNNLKEQSLEAIFVYSCSVRKAYLQNSTLSEIVPLNQIAPTFGFFTFGEFFSTNCSNELLNLTMTILGISEGKQINNSIQLENDEFSSKNFFEDRDLIFKKMFSKLVSEVTKELKEANEILEEQKSKIEKIKNITNSIMEINMKILSSEEFNSLLQMILDKAIEIIPGAKMGSILLLENDVLRYKATKGYCIKENHEAIYKLEDIYQRIKSSEYDLYDSIIISDLENYPSWVKESYMQWEKIVTKKPSEILTCCIVIDGKFMGMINLLNTEKGNKFNEDDKISIKHLADNISIAYKNSKLLESTLYMARYDGLTGLFNRHYFRKKLARIINKAQGTHENVIICLLDLNNLKSTNDAYGHEAGDALIKDFSTIFKAGIGYEDIMGRTGGDEFEVIFVNKSKEEVMEIIIRICMVCKKNPTSFKGQFIEISFAYGLAELYSDSVSIGKLLRLADNRMYEKKRMMKQEQARNL